MAAQPPERVRKRLVWFSPVVLAVALTPAFLQTQYTCERTGDTRLASLELEVLGTDRLTFDPAVLVGGGEVTVDLPPDGYSLHIGVFPPGGATNTYIVAINPACLPGFGCSDGNDCAANFCNPSTEQRMLTPFPDDTACDFAAIARGVCDGGACRARGWGTAELIEIDDVGNASSPQVAADSDGNSMAVCQQSDGTVTNIWANRYE